MWPYWLLFLFPAFKALTKLKVQASPTKRQNWSFLWRLMFVVLVLMIGLRHEVGGDWFIYIEQLDDITNGSTYDIKKIQDPAFSLINLIAIQSGFGVYLVNLISAIFFTYGVLLFCRTQPRSWLALVVAVPYLITVVAMGYTRQGAAIGIAMLGMVALSQGKTLQFMLWIFLAAIFHKSAIILVPLAILANNKQRILTWLWVSIGGILLFVLLLQESVDFLIYGYIESKYQSAGAAIRIAMNVVPAVFFLIFRQRFHLPQEQKIFWTSMSWIAVFFVILLFASPSSTAVDRVALYFIPLQLFVFSRLPDALGKPAGQNLGWVWAVVVYSAIIHFVWLLYADTAFAWLPYQFLPWIWLWR